MVSAGQRRYQLGFCGEGEGGRGDGGRGKGGQQNNAGQRRYILHPIKSPNAHNPVASIRKHDPPILEEKSDAF